jgi:hypothetical protein
MKLYDITKPLVDTLLGRKGSGVREQISSTEKSIYQQSHQWMDYNIYLANLDWYKEREREVMRQMYEYAKMQGFYINPKLVLNKNIKIL